jgi:lactate dehydrogenase-like 2-hydroxyacid dehydrogenase
LLKFQNVLVLPHLGSATKEARDGMAELAVKNVINVLKQKPALTPVF